MKRSTFILTLILILSMVLAGCQDQRTEENSEESTQDSTQQAHEPAYGGNLVYGMTQELVSLDPHQTTDAGTRSVVFNIYEGLVKPDSDGNLQPAVAESFTISEDAKVYTFTLREGLKFHDGSDVTVEDVLYSINRYAEVQGESSAFSSAIESVEAPDEWTVCVTLKEGNSEFLSQLTVAVIPAANPDPAGSPIGTGPFMVTAYKVGEYLDLAKFEDYRIEDRPYLDTVRFKFIADVNTAFTELQAGTIDCLNYLTVSQVQTLEKSNPDDYNIVEGTMNLVHAMFLNNEYEPFQDVRVRQALCYAINRDAINQYLFDGRSTIIGTHMIPSLTTWYNEKTSSVYSYDIEKAKELLKEAGYSNLSFTITVPSSYSQHVDTAQIIADELSEIGVKVSIQKVEWSAWLEDVYTNHDYEATVVGFDGKLNPSDWLGRYASTNAKNIANYKNDEYDALYAQALATTIESEKQELYFEMEMNLAQNAASVYIEDPADFVALSAKFAGYEFYPTSAWDVSLIYRIVE